MMKSVAFALRLILLAAQWSSAQSLDWSRQFGTSEDDHGTGVAADRLGNVYVVGDTEGDVAAPNAGQDDVFLAKYTAAGTPVWTRQLGTDSFDQSFDISTDSAGNVYITGGTHGGLGGVPTPFGDAFVSKFSADGSLNWTQQLGSRDGAYSYGVSADSWGNVYIAGDAYGDLAGISAGGIDSFVSKFDASGSFQWTVQQGTSLTDRTRGAATDEAGNVYICGTRMDNFHVASFVSKFDANGSLVWNQEFGEDTSGSYAIDVDGLGNVFVSGVTNGDLGAPNAGGNDVFVRKYDVGGGHIWTTQFGSVGNEGGESVVPDGLGGVYVSGGTGGDLDAANAGNGDAFVSKVDSDGTVIWTRQLGTTAGDHSYGVASDGLGNVYATGFTSGNLGGPRAGRWDTFLVKISDGARSPSGDTNGDGVVNIEDLNNVRNNVGGTGMGDTDGDGVVNIADLNTVRNNFGATAPQAVPEPATILLAACGSVAVLLQRVRPLNV